MLLHSKTIRGVCVQEVAFPRLDIASAEAFVSSFKSLAESKKAVVLDLTGVNHIDSAGLGALLGCHVSVKRQGGAFCVCAMKPVIKTAFDMACLDRLFPVFNTRREAVEAMAKG